MDLQKEREAFEAVTSIYHCIYNADLNYYFSGSKFVGNKAEIEVNAGWKAWQAAKAQALPEGYHLVKKPKPLIGHNKVDFSQAPKWAKFWLKDGYSKKCWWSSSRPKLDLDIGCFVFPLNNKPIEAPDFEFNGDWTKSITSRKAMIEAQ